VQAAGLANLQHGTQSSPHEHPFPPFIFAIIFITISFAKSPPFLQNYCPRQITIVAKIYSIGDDKIISGDVAHIMMPMPDGGDDDATQATNAIHTRGVGNLLHSQ